MKEKMRAEAIERMKILNLHPNVLNEFKNENKINFSEFNLGILYWADEKQMQYVKAFEEKYDCIVYHLIHDITSIGELLTMLYVSKNEEEWEEDRGNLKKGYAYAYVENITDELCSEIGGVMIQQKNGGVIRTA